MLSAALESLGVLNSRIWRDGPCGTVTTQRLQLPILALVLPSDTLETTERDWKRSILRKSNNIAHMADIWQNSQELQTQVIAEYSMHCNTYSIYVY